MSEAAASTVTMLRHRAVDPVMLFFDLIYVFLITELSTHVREDASPMGLVRAAIILVLLYWQWCLITVQVSLRDASTTRNRVAVMALMLLAIASAAALPGAFGISALLLALTVSASRLIITLALARHDESRAFRMDAMTAAVEIPLLIGGALVGGTAQVIAWGAAAAAELLAPVLHARTMSGQRYDVPHLVERFSLLIILALGETIVSISEPLTEISHLHVVELVALLASFTLVACLWWSYFHHSMGRIEEVISRSTTPFRAVRGLLVYSHLFLMAGLISVAAGLHHLMGEPGEKAGHEAAALLCLGVGIYHFVFVVMRLVTQHRLYISRACAALLTGMLTWIGTELSGAMLLSLVALILLAQNLWEGLAPASAGIPEDEELIPLP